MVRFGCFGSRNRLIYSMVSASLRQFIEHPKLQQWIMALIVVNAVLLGFETSANIMAQYGAWVVLADRIIIGIFLVEIGIKLWVYRLGFFKSGWNIFDLLIVGISIVPAQEQFSVLRALRILRVLRLLSAVPQMRKVVEALLQSIPGLFSIAGLLGIIFYVFAVLATKLFGTTPELTHLFGTIGHSMYTLFQVMTLEGWSGDVVKPVMEFFPLAWLFFIPFILISSFAVLNLFLALIVDSLNHIKDDQNKKLLAEIHKTETAEQVQLLAELQKLENQLQNIYQIIGKTPRP
jgi:voltage-gated sodium channel